MVKIHKSELVFLETNNPLILDMPEISVNLSFDEPEPPAEKVTEDKVTEKQNANKIIEEAKKEAELIIENAKQRADELINESMASGFEMGKNEARKELEEKIKSMELEFKEFMDSFNKKYDNLFNSIQSDVLELSINIAEKVINYELDKSEECYISMVKKALSKLKKDERANIRISEHDYNRIFQSLDRELQQYEGKISAIVDEGLSKGDLIVETPNEIIDAGVSTQINTIAACLYKG